ncbi:MAG: hypothetical protein ACI8V2_001833 [Candidatus Latescibacterota bacterium]|jgi:hypothetical protein
MKTASRILIVLSIFVLSGCATLREVAALRKVDFSLSGIGDPALAGVSLRAVRSYKDIGFLDAGRLALALASKDLPLTFVLHVRAENPADNPVPARFVGMAWTLFLQDKETISGAIDQSIVLQPGEPQDVPIVVGLNLMEFFDGGIGDLVNVASSLAGKDGSATSIRLQVTPTIDTSLGPIKYPQPITVINRRIGS